MATLSLRRCPPLSSPAMQSSFSRRPTRAPASRATCAHGTECMGQWWVWRAMYARTCARVREHAECSCAGARISRSATQRAPQGPCAPTSAAPAPRIPLIAAYSARCSRTCVCASMCACGHLYVCACTYVRPHPPLRPCIPPQRPRTVRSGHSTSCCGHTPMLCRMAAMSLATSRPVTRAAPAVGGVRPVRTWMSVVLPALR